MIQERKDSRGRTLFTGESQLRNGSYVYRYTDEDGVRHSISNWRLLPSDLAPNGSAEHESLRETEERIKRNLRRGQPIIANDALTLNDYWEKYISLKCGLSENTLVSYIYLYNKHVRNDFGKRRIRSITYTDIMRFFIEKLRNGLHLTSLENMHNVMNPLFTLAVKEGYLEFNPMTGVLSEFRKRKDWGGKTIEALTEKEQAALVDFVAGSHEYRQWLPMITLFLGTGMRCGELIGLTWNDIDFKKNVIHVNHTLNYDITLEGKCKFFITSPKTKAGNRDIPMLSDVKDTLLELYERKDDFNSEYPVTIDGYTDFIFRDLQGKVYTNYRINRCLKSIQAKYNQQETERAASENREPLLLPAFTAHALRHTFITRIVEGRISIRSAMAIAGHAYAGTTLKVYSSVNASKQQEEMAALNGLIKIK